MSITVKTADMLRQIRLEVLLVSFGARHYKSDSKKWHTNRGTLSLCGQKFWNWNTGGGGGGAIDLAMHLMSCDYKTALSWLSNMFSIKSRDLTNKDEASSFMPKPLILPKREDRNISLIVTYLHQQRAISLPLIQQLISCGKLYADQKANAVFVLWGKNKTIVGAELRGTSHRKWCGMATGSRKNPGCFYVNTPGSKKVILCESAIDALSYYVIDNQCRAVSTAGAQPNPAWLKYFVDQNFEIMCGFDADEKGDKMAQQMISLYPSVKRLRPYKHDWNYVLTTKSNNQHSSYFFLPSSKKKFVLNKNYQILHRKDL